MELLVVNAGRAERVYKDGREYLVADLSLIVPGVLPGSRGPLLYPPDEVSVSTPLWDGMPLTRNHPVLNGRNVSAKTKGVFDAVGLGYVRDPVYNQKLRAKGWFDVQFTRDRAPEIYEALVRGEPIELSTGLYTENHLAANGATHNGRPYTHIAKDYKPDHVAVLTNERGACSLRDGCGVLVNSTLVTNSGGHMGCGCDECGKSKAKKGKAKIPLYPTMNCGGKGGTRGPCKGQKKGAKSSLGPVKTKDQRIKEFEAMEKKRFEAHLAEVSAKYPQKKPTAGKVPLADPTKTVYPNKPKHPAWAASVDTPVPPAKVPAGIKGKVGPFKGLNRGVKSFKSSDGVTDLLTIDGKNYKPKKVPLKR